MKSREEIKQCMDDFEEKKIPFLLLMNFEGTQGDIYSKGEWEEQGIQFCFPKMYYSESRMDQGFPAMKKSPMAKNDYAISFEKVMQHIRYGNSFLTNLTCSTPIELTDSLEALFPCTDAKYRILYKKEWLCFSPETFIQIKERKIHSYPMKGTMDAAIPDAEEKILKDEKETAEHYTIVDLIRNDMSMVAENVTVKRFRYIDKIKTNQKELLQVSSHLEGDLLPDKKLSDIIFPLLPAGSISGAPKKKTVEIIHEAEAHERNFYTGTAYYFDGESLDSCVLIRFIEKTEKGFVYKSGGGITINSELVKEYQEMVDKVYLPLKELPHKKN